MPQFDEYGNVLYHCYICHDQGWVHPVDENGKPIWGDAKRCQCKVEISRITKEEQEELRF